MPRIKGPTGVRIHKVHGSAASYHAGGKTYNASKAGKRAAFGRARALRKGKKS